MQKKKAAPVHTRTMAMTIRKGHPFYASAARVTKCYSRIKNATNYLIQHNPKDSAKLMKHADADKWLKANNRELYDRMPSSFSQRATQIVGAEWASYLTALKAYKIKPESFERKPRKPGYARRATTAYISVNGFRIENGTVHFLKGFLNPFKTPFSFSQDFNHKAASKIVSEIRIVPLGNSYDVELIYDESKLAKEGDYCPLLDKNRKAGIDLGINNLIAFASDQPDVRPVLINGRPIKSINAYYNKRLAQLRSLKKYKHLSAVSAKRNRAIKDYIHRATTHIVRYCIENNIGYVAIGKNKQWKKSINIGTVNNQKFVQIPHAMLIDIFTYKCRSAGITTAIQEEAYTSKASALDNDLIPEHKANTDSNVVPIFSGKRVKRGLYRFTNGLINADINGALNILRKATGESLSGELICRGLVYCPVQLNVSRHTVRTRSPRIMLPQAA